MTETADGRVCPIEDIPDEHKLYLRVSGIHFNGMPYDPNIIIQQGGDGISVDWCKYSTVQDCLDRGKPGIDGVVSFNVGEVRGLQIPLPDIKTLTVRHAPSQSNRAHSLVVRLPGKGRKQDKRIIRNLLYGVMNVEIHSPYMVNP